MRVLQFHSFVSLQRISSTSTGRTERRYWRRAELSALSHRTRDLPIQSQLGHIPTRPQLRPSRETAEYLSALPSSFLAWNTRALMAATATPIPPAVSWGDKSPASRNSPGLRFPSPTG